MVEISTAAELGRRVSILMLPGSHPAEEVIAALTVVVNNANPDEVLALLEEALQRNEVAPGLGPTPAQQVRSLAVQLLTAELGLIPLDSARRVEPLVFPLADWEDDPQWDLQREFLSSVPDRFTLELGYRARDLLAFRYQVTVPATDEAFEPSPQRDGEQLPLIFERLLWAWEITKGFTDDPIWWPAMKAPVHPERMPPGHYVKPAHQIEFVRKVHMRYPQLIWSLTPGQLEALARHRYFQLLRLPPFPVGHDATVGRRYLRDARLQLIWAYRLLETGQ